MYLYLIDLEKENDNVNRKVLWEVLRMYDCGRKLFNGILKNICYPSNLCKSKNGLE